MSQHKALVETFYQAFQQKDYKTMTDCYHPDVYFRDEAFELTGKAVGAMWHMLCERGADMKMNYSVKEENDVVTAHWEPTYTFSQTGRFVHNIVDAQFEFKDGKIIKHIDQFNFWRWSRQALGFTGTVLGWAPILRKKVNAMASISLSKFIEKHAEYLS
jgi:ketosteroid isomerase-like protein